MKTIGLLGGMSWESTQTYYKVLNECVKQKLGGLNSAKICLVSVNFAELEECIRRDKWQEIARILAQSAVRVEKGGADCLLLCTNTMHKVFSEIEQEINIPFFHIVDATAKKLLKDGVRTVGLLGTKFTMEEAFFKERLSMEFKIQTIVPCTKDQEMIHNIIFQELFLGVISSTARSNYLRVMEELKEQGAQAVIFGCTEIELLVKQHHTKIPIYDTTFLHAEDAVYWALKS